MNYLLDTCVISDFIKGQQGVVQRLLSIPPDLITVSVISRMEVDYGLRLNEDRARKLKPKLDLFFETVHLIPFELPDALAAAKVRADLRKVGTPIGPFDLLLAGSALSRSLVMVTSNTGEFSRVRGLKMEDWRT